MSRCRPSWWRWMRPALLSLVALATLAGPPGAGAQGRCPKDLDACLFVTSNADTDARDDALTLREALLLTQNHLQYADLTAAEQAHVVFQGPSGPANGGANPNTPPGLGGPGGIGGTSKLAIYFDPAVFCAGCPGNTIMLTPPGFGGPGGIGGYGGGKVLALAPLADPLATAVSGASKWVERVGGGYLPNVGEVPTTVILDGSGLTAGHAGLWAGSRGVTLRGLTLRGFPGTAVELECKVADGVALEHLTYEGNGQDVETVGCAAPRAVPADGAVQPRAGRARGAHRAGGRRLSAWPTGRPRSCEPSCESPCEPFVSGL